MIMPSPLPLLILLADLILYALDASVTGASAILTTSWGVGAVRGRSAASVECNLRCGKKVKQVYRLFGGVCDQYWGICICDVWKKEITRLFSILSRALQIVLLVDMVEQVKGVLDDREERKEIPSLSGKRAGIKQAKLTKLASIRILILVILECLF
jgi:hypothetical protein